MNSPFFGTNPTEPRLRRAALDWRAAAGGTWLPRTSPRSRWPRKGSMGLEDGYSQPARWRLLDFKVALRAFLRRLWTSTRDLPRSVGTAGPQPPDRMPEYMPDRMPDTMSEYMSDRMPDRMSEYMSDRLPNRMPEHMSDRMPGYMSDKLSEYIYIYRIYVQYTS